MATPPLLPELLAVGQAALPDGAGLVFKLVGRAAPAASYRLCACGGVGWRLPLRRSAPLHPFIRFTPPHPRAGCWRWRA